MTRTADELKTACGRIASVMVGTRAVRGLSDAPGGVLHGAYCLPSRPILSSVSHPLRSLSYAAPT